MKSKLKRLRRKAFIDTLEVTLLFVAILTLLIALSVIAIANWHRFMWLVIVFIGLLTVALLIQYIELLYDIQVQYRVDYMSVVREERTHDR